FGESVPSKRKKAAYSLVDASSSLLVAGSSLAVMSGMRFVLEARKQNKPVAIINGAPGRADTRATTLWRTQVAPAFDELLDALDLSECDPYMGRIWRRIVRAMTRTRLSTGKSWCRTIARRSKSWT